MRQIEVLVAVDPEPLLTLLEHLLERSEFRVIKKLHTWSALQKQSSKLHPHLIITNSTLLGDQAASIIAALKIASPRSKVIVISFPHDLSREARQWGADAYLEEEHLVRRLLPTARKLLLPNAPISARQKPAASPLARASSSAKTQDESSLLTKDRLRKGNQN